MEVLTHMSRFRFLHSSWFVVIIFVTLSYIFLVIDSATARAQDNSTAPATIVGAAAVLTPTPWTPPEPAYRITVLADGIYALNHTTLQNAGLPVSTLDPRTLRMFYLGQEMAIQVQGESDGRFDPADQIIFHGRSIDSLYYAGLLSKHYYTGSNLYWLSYGGPTGKRMTVKTSSATGTPTQVFFQTDRQEQQVRYVTEYPRYENGALFNPADDHWLWYRLQIFGATGTRSQTFTFNVNDLASLPVTATLTNTLTVRVVGGYNSVHGLRLYVNGVQVFQDSTKWRTFQPFTAVANLPAALLVNGANTVQVEMFNVNSNISENYIDWVELRYAKNYRAVANQLAFAGEQVSGSWRYTVTNFLTNTVKLFDVTDLHNVQQIVSPTISGSGPYTVTLGDSEANRHYWLLTPAQYLPSASVARVTRMTSPYTPSRLLSISTGVTQTWDLLHPSNGADWIVITHRDFWTATLPLATYRSQKLRVAMVDVQAIYDQFNGGMLSSEAIRDFLAYTAANWRPPAPRYVLLAGAGTNDMRRYLSNSRPTYVPTFIYPADPILGETAADNRLVTFAGNDILPDMAIGRFPAYTAVDISTMVSKTLRYEAAPTFNTWNTNVVFVSDDLEGGGGNFYEFSNILADGSYDPTDLTSTKYLPNPYRALKVYLGQTCDQNNPATAVQCRAQLTDMLNNQGALLLSYVGHAQTGNWAVEKMLDISLATSLTNTNRLPIFLPMACFEGFFHLAATGSRSLSEAYLLNPNGGAVASWSPAGFGVATGHDWLEQGFFRALFHEEITVLGDVTKWGKEFLARSAPPSKYDDLIETYNLLGDPALQIQVHTQPTAVELAGFTAVWGEEGVVVDWATQSESEIAAFYLLRRSEATGEYLPVNAEPLPARHPGSTSGASYMYLDTNVQPDQPYWYKLAIVKLDGSLGAYGPVEVSKLGESQRIFLPQINVQ